MSRELSRGRALVALSAITAVGAAFRFYGLAWGAPYFHFHIDEHFVFMGADLLRSSNADAAMSAKFFMYSPGPMYAVNLVRAVYEWFAGAKLDLSVMHDQVVYMVLGRAISATVGTLTIPLVYLVAVRAAGRRAGIIAAGLLAVTVIHLRDSHFFTVDISLTFFCTLCFYFLVRMVQTGGMVANLAGGVAFGLAVLSKYTAVFLMPLIGLANLLSPRAPATLKPWSAWGRPVLRAIAATAAGIATFLILDPLVIEFFDKFRQDLRDQVVGPLLGAWPLIFFAHFTNIASPQLYWFTNLLWWGLGPAFEIAALLAIVWLLAQRNRVAAIVALYPVVFLMVAGRSVAPFIRYTLPLAPGLAIVLGVAAAGWLERDRWRRPALVALAAVFITTGLWAVAYMNVFRAEDVRLTASEWLTRNVPRGANILVEPHHNIPPTGSYLTSQTFYGDYVLWGRGDVRHDHFNLYGLDTYRYLYNPSPTDDERRIYIDSRLNLVDWILMDDTYVQWYRELPAPQHAVMKQYYRDLFSGALRFELVKTFEVYPSLFGWPIKDDGAELTFRLFDHPRIFVFRRIS